MASGYTRFQSSSGAASANSMALEQSQAELQLLKQSLLQSKRITERTTHLLTEFDDRLSKLEKNSLVPLYQQTGRLTRISKNIETAMRSIDGLLGHSDLVERESPLLNKGPNPNDLGPYLEAMDRLASAAEAIRKTDPKGQAATLVKMVNLLQVGARNLVKVFSQWLRDTSPTVDAGSLFDSGKPFPSLSAAFLDNALMLISHLRALPEIGPTVSKDLESAYAEVRGTYLETSLANCAKDVTSSISGISSVGLAGRKGIGRFLDVMFSLVKSEHALLGTVFTSASTRKEIYSSILEISLELFVATCQQLNSLVKKSLSSLVSVAFASFAELSDRVIEFEEWIRSRGDRKNNELGELIHSFRGTCLTSLPEFLSDVKVWGSKAPVGAEVGAVGVNAMTSNVLAFMRQLSDNQPAVESFLAILGPGNWGGPSRPALSAQAEETSLMTRYLNDVLTTLLVALDSRAKFLRSPKPGMGPIFLLNNISYVRREVHSSQIGDLLGEACEDSLNKLFRSAKSNYLEIWSPLIKALLDAPAETSGATQALKAGLGVVKGGGEKRETKDRFIRFQEAFEEVEALHQVARLDESEVELRERMKEEAEKMIVPSYSKYFARHKNGEFSKSSAKYLKLDATALSERMAALFE